MMNLIRRWRAVWNPDMYHGWGKTENYFEGWYFKIVDPKENEAFAIIPGISLGAEEEQHAFIQVLNGTKCKATYHNFPLDAFQPSDQSFELRLGNNLFSNKELVLDLPELKGSLKIQHPYPWPKMLGAPGIMGWYSFIPFMQCYHGIVSMNHSLEGKMEVDGQPTDFTGGKGYIEKDWGQSFPSSWIWMQSNHFNSDKRVSLQASVANIPWLGSYFIGYIVGFLVEDKLYRFATYTGAMMKASLGEDEVILAFKDRKNRLEIIAKKATGSDLVSPVSGNMVGKVNESMQAEIEVRLFEKEQLIFSGTGRNAGMEVAGPVEELLTEKWRR